MKKHIFAIFIFFMLLISYYSVKIEKAVDDQNENVVIKYIEDSRKEMIDRPDDQNIYYLLFDEHHLNIMNLKELFSFFNLNNYDFRINAVYPYINPIYKTKLVNIERISFNSNRLSEISKDFYDIYTKELSKQQLNDELEKSYKGDIKIRMIKITSLNKSMDHFLKTYQNIKYSCNQYGLFKKRN